MVVNWGRPSRLLFDGQQSVVVCFPSSVSRPESSADAVAGPFGHLAARGCFCCHDRPIGTADSQLSPLRRGLPSPSSQLSVFHRVLPLSCVSPINCCGWLLVARGRRKPASRGVRAVQIGVEEDYDRQRKATAAGLGNSLLSEKDGGPQSGVDHACWW